MKKASLIAVVAAAALALAGCTSSTPEPAPAPTGGATDPAAPAELIPVTVGVIPIVDVAAAYLAKEQGFFEEEGLDVTLELAQGGAAIVPAVISGEFEFGFSNVTSLLLAVNNGVPIKAVAPGLFVPAETPDIGGIAVPAGSDIKTAADLVGKTVAVNTLNNIGDSTIRNVVEKAGGDPMGVEFVEMGFPDMPAALSSNQVDAIWIMEPHLSRAVAEGAEVISWNFWETDPNLMVATYFASNQFAAENPEVVASFVAGLEKAFAYADANPDAVRAVLDSYTQIDPSILDAMPLPRFDLPFSEDTVSLLADLALKYGLVSAPIDYSPLLP